ncbi:hypothetical protein J2X36_003589 [Methylobacterium sp. BE186]|nr:hypothetical protein [Methylobacterium sp. BE186]
MAQSIGLAVPDDHVNIVWLMRSDRRVLWVLVSEEG